MSEFAMVVYASKSVTTDYRKLCSTLDRLLFKKQSSKVHLITTDNGFISKLIRQYAQDRGYNLHVFPLNWEKYGKSAEYRRNNDMFNYLLNFEQKIVYAMWNGCQQVEHFIKLANHQGIPTRIGSYQ